MKKSSLKGGDKDYLSSHVTFTWNVLSAGKQQQYQLQWGSEIRPSLDFEWSKTGWVTNGLDFKWDLKSGSPTI